MRAQHEKEMQEMRKKMESEKQSKAAMKSEIESMKQQYEEKLKELEERAQTAPTSQSQGIAPPSGALLLQQQQQVNGHQVRAASGQPGDFVKPVGGVTNQMQQEAMLK